MKQILLINYSEQHQSLDLETNSQWMALDDDTYKTFVKRKRNALLRTLDCSHCLLQTTVVLCCVLLVETCTYYLTNELAISQTIYQPNIFFQTCYAFVSACEEGRYGAECTFECDCDNGASCDLISGLCKCLKGWIGPRCEHPLSKYHTQNDHN